MLVADTTNKDTTGVGGIKAIMNRLSFAQRYIRILLKFFEGGHKGVNLPLIDDEENLDLLWALIAIVIASLVIHRHVTKSHTHKKGTTYPCDSRDQTLEKSWHPTLRVKNC